MSFNQSRVADLYLFLLSLFPYPFFFFPFPFSLFPFPFSLFPSFPSSLIKLIWSGRKKKWKKKKKCIDQVGQVEGKEEEEEEGTKKEKKNGTDQVEKLLQVEFYEDHGPFRPLKRDKPNKEKGEQKRENHVKLTPQNKNQKKRKTNRPFFWNHSIESLFDHFGNHQNWKPTQPPTDMLGTWQSHQKMQRTLFIPGHTLSQFSFSRPDFRFSLPPLCQPISPIWMKGNSHLTISNKPPFHRANHPLPGKQTNICHYHWPWPKHIPLIRINYELKICHFPRGLHCDQISTPPPPPPLCTPLSLLKRPRGTSSCPLVLK